MARSVAFARKGSAQEKGGVIRGTDAPGGVGNTIIEGHTGPGKTYDEGEAPGNSVGPDPEGTGGVPTLGMGEDADDSQVACCPGCGMAFDDMSGKQIPVGHRQHPASQQHQVPASDDDTGTTVASDDRKGDD